MDFSTIKAITIPEGVVKKISIGNNIIWEEPSSYKNWVPYSINTDGSIFNGTGWIGKTRLSSSGATKSADYASTTGYIPAKAGDVVRIAGTGWLDSNYLSTNYVCTYDSDFNFIAAVNCGGVYGGGTVSGDLNVAVVTLKDTSTIAYIRVSSSDASGNPVGVDGPGDNLIVTINEEIV
jgi:hypothetical protein